MAATTRTLSATSSSSSIALPTATGQCRAGWRDLFTAHDDSWFRPEEEALCSTEWYGHPLPEDCVVALNQLPQNNGHFEFLGPGVEPAGNGRDRDGCLVDSPPLRGPIIKTHGTCTAALTHQHADEYLSIELYEVRQAWIALYDKCVVGEGAGGIIMPPRWWIGGLEGEIPVITLSGPNSRFNQAMKLRYLCQYHPDGSAVCPNIEGRSRPSSSGGLDTIAEGSTPPTGVQSTGTGEGKKRCSGTCYNPEDCDINSDCLCAAKKDLLQDSSWGQHVCMHVAGAAIALSSTLMKPRGLCRGRCALEDDGTLLFAAVADSVSNLTNQTTTRTSATDPPIPTQTLQFNNSDQPLINNSVAGQFNFSDSNDHETFFSPPEASEIICPCNCTYVSAACCLSKLVWEDSSLQVHVDPPPTNANLACDEVSGRWAAGTSSAFERGGGNGSSGGFVALGTVRWNASGDGH